MEVEGCRAAERQLKSVQMLRNVSTPWDTQSVSPAPTRCLPHVTGTTIIMVGHLHLLNCCTGTSPIVSLHGKSPTSRNAIPTPPPPLRKHGQGQKNNGHTGSPCLDKPVLSRDAQHKETLHTENLPVPHTKHITHQHGTRTQCVG